MALTRVLVAAALVLALVSSCTSGRSDQDVAELEALDTPGSALSWLTGGDDTSVEDRDVSARLAGLLTDDWPDDGDTAANVLTSALSEAPADEDRARMAAQMLHVVAHEEIAEEPVRKAVATVLAAHTRELRQILVTGVGTSIHDGWTTSFGGSPAPAAEPSTVTDALTELGDASLTVLTGIAHERRREIVAAAAAAGEPRTVDTLLASDTASVIRNGDPNGTMMNYVLTHGFESAEARLRNLSIAVEAAFAVPLDATAGDLTEAAETAEPSPATDASRVLELLNIDALLEAGFLDPQVDPEHGLPPATVIDGRLDPWLKGTDPAKVQNTGAVDRFNAWSTGADSPTQPFELLSEDATGAALIDLP